MRQCIRLGFSGALQYAEKVPKSFGNQGGIMSDVKRLFGAEAARAFPEAADLFSYQLLPGYFGVDDYASLLDSIRRSVGERQWPT